MEIKFSNENHVDVVQLSGRLTANDVSAIRREINNFIKNGTANLLLDITELEFIDSSGLGLLVGSRREARKHNGDLILLGPKPEVRALLELTRLDQIFSIFNDQAEAVNSLH